MNGIISIYRSGKHWLVAGIFDTLGVYPINYLNEVNKDIILATGRQTNFYSITYNGINFSSVHERPTPYNMTDKFILLDRKNKELQAISFIKALATKRHAAYSDKGAETLNKLGNLIKINKNKLQQTINFLENHKLKVLQSLKGTEYIELFYEDLIKDYEYNVKMVIKYLFNKDVEKIRYIRSPKKLNY